MKKKEGGAPIAHCRSCSPRCHTPFILLRGGVTCSCMLVHACTFAGILQSGCHMCDIWLLKYLTNKSDKRSCLLVNPLLTMATPYSREIDRASQSVTPYRSGQAKTLLQYPWHSSAILMSQSFQDWIGQHESNEDMKDVIQVISVFLYPKFLIFFSVFGLKLRSL